jgi:hypothetical protein
LSQSQAEQALHIETANTDKAANDYEAKALNKSESNNILKDFCNKAEYRNTLVGGVNAVLHALAAIFSSKDGEASSGFGRVCDKAAFICTRWVAPFLSFGWAAVESFMKRKPVEGFIKGIPPALLSLCVGDANIDIGYGVAMGLNCPYDITEAYIKEKSKKSEAYKEHVEKSNATALGNAKLTWEAFKEVIKDFKSLDFTSRGLMTVSAGIVAGSLPIVLFARKARDTMLAKVFGLLRNLSGMGGDAFFIFGKNVHPLKRLVGVCCALAALLGIPKRWITDNLLVKTLIHGQAALDVGGYAAWNALSGMELAKKKQEVATPIVPAAVPLMAAAA